MQRRDALRLLGAALIPALQGLSPDELLAFGRETLRQAADPRRAQFLNEHQFRTVDQVSELVIPATDTPGAQAAGVAGFIDVIVGKWYPEEERARFLEGLADLDARSRAGGGKDFLSLAPAKQVALLQQLDVAARALPSGSPPAFFTRIKGLTLLGYYTSEIGIKQELQEEFMPGRFDGAVRVTRRRPH